MRIYPLGYTKGGAQAFISVAEPILLRLTKAEGKTSELPEGTLTQLLSAFIGDTQPAPAPAIRPFLIAEEHYSGDFAMYRLMDDPRTKAVLNKYAPATVQAAQRFSLLSVLPFSALVDTNPEVAEMARSFGGPFAVSPEKFALVSRALSQIAVHQSVPRFDHLH